MAADESGAPEAYLDHAASTPLRPRARAAWLEAADAHHANPTGGHRASRDARRALDAARTSIAGAMGREPGEVVFTSGGSEADNLAVRGVLRSRGGRAVCSAGEHHAVLEPTLDGGGLTFGLTAEGSADQRALTDLLSTTEDVSLVSVISVNNETGSISSLADVADVVREHAPGALLHTDAVQAVQWIDIEKTTSMCDLVSVTAHKIGGPVGIGALVVRDGVGLDPLILGGGQERGRRAGTPAVAQAVSFAAALDEAVDNRDADVGRLTALRDRLLEGLGDSLGDRLVVTTGADRERVAGGIAHICVRDVDSEALLFLLDADGVRASAASSCSSGAQEPSHVLAAMGVERELALGSVRLSLGHTTGDADIDRALEVIPAAISRLDRFGGG